MIHPAGHVPPDSDYTSTAIVYGTHPTMTTPPAAAVHATRTTTPPGGTAISSVNINFSGTSNVTWKWNKATDTFLRFYNGTTPDMLANNVQNQAANVVVQYVQISYGPWLENDEGGKEVQADLYPNASGTAVIYRNGYAIPGTWHRSTLGSPTQFVNAFGVPIPHAARPDLGRAGAQHHHGDDDALGRPTPSRPGRLPRHHRQQQAVLGGGEHARDARWPRPRRTRPAPRHAASG